MNLVRFRCMNMSCTNNCIETKYLKLQKKIYLAESADFIGVPKNTPRLRLPGVVSTVTFKGGDKL